MNAEINTETTAKEQPKSKRLSSFIWILVWWGIVYSISENWRAFQNNALVLGLWPFSIFLLMSIFQRAGLYQSIFRWIALVSTVICFFVGVAIFGIGSGARSLESFNFFSQIVVTIFVASFVLFVKWVVGKKNG